MSFTWKTRKEVRFENIPDGSISSLLSFKILQEDKLQLICVT